MLGNGFRFIETSRITDERIAMGWGIDTYPSYVIKSYESDLKTIIELIDDADVVIVGGQLEEFLKSRKKDKKIIIRYSERPLKKQNEFYKLPFRFLKWHLQNPRKVPIYLLCASAFASSDYNRLGLFKNKSYKWGYFPPFIAHNIDELFDYKNSLGLSLLFVGRFIPLKRPDYPIKALCTLRQEGIDAHLTMIGSGPLNEEIYNYISKEGVGDHITILPSTSPENVRRIMDSSDILMFTSDKNEGWGAVVNEAMNSGCVVVGSSKIGSIPFLINDGHNGMIFRDGDFDDFYNKVKKCCLDGALRERLGRNAYASIEELWNPHNAAQRLLFLLNDLVSYGYCRSFQEGPCSQSEILKDGWYN